MGIDLKILASNFRERRGEILSSASIRLDRDPRLLSLFTKEAQPCLVTALPLGVKVGHYEDDGLKFDEKDRHGQPLTFTTAERLRDLHALEGQQRGPFSLAPRIGVRTARMESAAGGWIERVRNFARDRRALVTLQHERPFDCLVGMIGYCGFQTCQPISSF